jgi:hypothetical protein
MKRSNTYIIGAGVAIAILILATVITARVVFDRSVVVQPPGGRIITVETRF